MHINLVDCHVLQTFEASRHVVSSECVNTSSELNGNNWTG